MIHFCKKCGSLYTDSVGFCSKCNALELQQKQASADASSNDSITSEKADKGTVLRQWFGIIVGIPLFILFLYLVIYIYKSILY